MQRLLAEALDAGGASGSPPACSPRRASTPSRRKCTRSASVLKRHGGAYSSHVRDEANHVLRGGARGDRRGRGLRRARADRPSQALGHRTTGAARRSCSPRSTAARQRGVRVDCDAYPVRQRAAIHCAICCRRWVQEGGMPAMLERLARPRRARRAFATRSRAQGLNNFGRIPSWDAVRIAISPHQPEYAGRTLGDIARAPRHRSARRRLRLHRRRPRPHAHRCRRRCRKRTCRRSCGAPWVLVGSDGTSLAHLRDVTSQGKPHPRFYGTFPRVLGHYVRDLGLLSLAAWRRPR